MCFLIALRGGALTPYPKGPNKLKIHYNMSFEDVCKKFVRFFPVAFRYTSEEWSAMVTEASRDHTSKRARFSQKDLYQLYEIK